ncbi:MAG: efflux RND transporter periplasmic adaptor subunit [Prolixibacteraceae bacterium]|nr:efflux RND transporter periplasmic adaptor subunit [Prolixibacteraceae bacterium]
MRKSKKVILTSLILVILSVSSFLVFTGTDTQNVNITTPVKRGTFEILVYSSGQLEAQSSENIVVPDILRDRNVRIYEIKITDLVEEGTVVEKGDYVASLDHKAVEEVLVAAQEDLETALNSFEDAKMDSNLTLSNYRDLIINAKEEVEETQIILDESIYESPAVIRKAEMDLDKAKRKLNQEIKAYELREKQAQSRVERYLIELRRRQSRVDILNEVYQSLRIIAPQSGMLIYERDRTREKIKVGSTVSAWRPVIATLPDLSSMLSLTYINEIDISKVKVGQKVTLGIDALPDVKLEGEVTAVANIGQPMPKSDAKVFEVKIRVLGDVSNLKPAMTTSNVIQTGLFEDTLFIPSETVFENDSMQFVYLEKNGTVVKQVVDLGDENENYILVRKGLSENDKLLLSVPENNAELSYNGMDIYQEIKERKLKEEEEAKKAIEEGKSEPLQLEEDNEDISDNQTNISG